MSTCHGCGAEYTPGAAKCAYCGAAFSAPRAPAPMRQMQMPPVVGGVEQKSRTAAGLFGIFLGALGVHNFYLGYTGKAVAQLLITILTAGVLAPVSAIWGLVEGIMILSNSISTDANGVPLKD